MRLSKILLFSILASVSSFAQTGTPLTFDANVDPGLKIQVLNDLIFVQGIVGSKTSPLHQEIFGTVDGANYFKWFNSRVFYFGVSDCGSSSAVACVEPADKHKIWVTDNYIKISHPQIARLMTVFHEARHTEDQYRNWPHATCPRKFPYRSIWTGGKLALHAACDATAYGSYSSASVMLNNVSKFCSNCTAKVMSDSKLYSDDQVKRVINVQAKAKMDQDFLY